MSERISFLEAITDPLLLKTAFDEFSFPQQVALKALYGLPLSKDRFNIDTGLTELDYWAMSQGNFEHDELGYPTKITDTAYVPKEYNQLWGVIGRRVGKTSVLGSMVLAYECTLGGHTEWVKPGQPCVAFMVAHKLPIAQANLAFVAEILESSPVLKEEIVDRLADRIKLANGIEIQPSPASLKAQRGLACPVVVMDEVAFWYSDAEAANPDVEVERAIAKSQLQFPHYKRVGLSSPWTKEGLLWKYYKAGTDGLKLQPEKQEPYKGKLVIFGTTAAFENPALQKGGGRQRLREEYLEDPDSYERECLCRFPDAVSGFIGRELLEKAVSKGTGISERPPVDPLDAKTKIVPQYVAAMDPAFRHDSFGFCILHKDATNGIVLDLLRQWEPIKGTKLNPKEVLAEINQILNEYGLSHVYTDQYQFESLQALALDLGLMIEGVDFTNRSKAKIYGNLHQIINQGKLVLLDPDLSQPAATLVREIAQLERRMTPTGAIQIKAPEGKHDDMATVLALAAVKAVWQDPIVKDEGSTIVKEPTAFERAMQTIKSKQRQDQLG